jgi:protein-S-isoprenylcysteine O-methyltransferase Ste14
VKASDFLHSIATGPEERRRRLTPFGLVVFIGMVLLVIFASLGTDQVLGLPALLAGRAGLLVGIPLLVVGVPLWVWCVVLFWRERGTPVPFNPPRELVVRGPYAHVRNPMLTALFLCLFGLGFCLHSPSMVVLWTPVFVAANVVEVKLIEEPELERRFGESYREYKRAIPMFIPGLAWLR